MTIKINYFTIILLVIIAMLIMTICYTSIQYSDTIIELQEKNNKLNEKYIAMVRYSDQLFKLIIDCENIKDDQEEIYYMLQGVLPYLGQDEICLQEIE